MAGIKETKEALVAVNALSIFMIERLKDGVGIDDAIATFEKVRTDTVFRGKLKDAFDGVQNIPDEIKDLDIDEIAELVGVLVGAVPAYVRAFTK